MIAAGTAQIAVRFHSYHLGFLGDDYDFLLAREGLSAHTLLQPHNEHLTAVGVLLYRAIFAVVGISDAVPYIALMFLCLWSCAVLSFLFVRRELGPWIALIPPLLMVTLGPAAEALLWPFEFTLFSALALWLGATLAIQRGTTGSDAIGCALLVLGIGSESVVVTLLPATALALVLWSGWRNAWRRAWIVALPLVLWVAWYAAYQPHTDHHLAQVPGFVVDSFVATVAALFGVGSSAWGTPLAALLIAAMCVRCLYLRRVPPTSLYMGVGLLTVWLALGFTANALEPAAESRYQFQNSLLLMLALAPLTPRFRLTLLRGGLLVAIVGTVVALNLGRYGPWESAYAYQESIANAELAALQVARPAIVDSRAVAFYSFEPGLLWPFTPKAYFDAIDAHGSPVRVDRDLVRASQAARTQADVVIVTVEQISVLAARERSGTIRPRSAAGVRLQPAGAGCVVIPAGAGSAGIQVVAPPGGLIVRAAPGPSVGVGAARFADPPAAVALSSVLGAGEAVIATKPDASHAPWRFQLTAQQAVTVCSLAE